MKSDFSPSLVLRLDLKQRPNLQYIDKLALADFPSGLPEWLCSLQQLAKHRREPISLTIVLRYVCFGPTLDGLAKGLRAIMALRTSVIR